MQGFKNIKSFFRSLCNSSHNKKHYQSVRHSLNQSIDVSHLATPHSPARSVCSIPQAQVGSIVGQINDDISGRQSPQNHTPPAIRLTQQQQPNLLHNSSELNQNYEDGHSSSDAISSSSFHQQPIQQAFTQDPFRVLNVSESQNTFRPMPSTSQQKHELPTPQARSQIAEPSDPIRRNFVDNFDQQQNTTTKLSYDIISVREPLAKVLAERQQQQLRQQSSNDHEYIEVYGERSSSCFYEEIAGSTASSTTYDQIDAVPQPFPANQPPSNNLVVTTNTSQILVNNAATSSGYVGGSNIRVATDNINDGGNHANFYVVASQQSNESAQNSSNSPHQGTSNLFNQRSCENNEKTKSMPVYSVVNKATKPNRLLQSVGNLRPPQPPPKNQQLPSLGLPIYELLEDIPDSQPSSSSYNPNNMASHSKTERLPQPPPRIIKHRPFNFHRPLPPENNFHSSIDDNNNSENADNDGYEFLRSYNLADNEDMIDVGYERIKESNRYSGDSIMRQSLVAAVGLDNGGYESVQPIYSSPSGDTFGDPNYEAIGPATPSELAAAAAARLSAAATFLEQSKPDKHDKSG